MLRKFSAALIATAIIASPAFAASPMGASPSTPAATTTATAPANTATKPVKTVKTVKTVKHQHKPLVRHHVVAKNKRHVKLSAKPRRQHIVLHSRKTTKTVKADKTHNSKTHETSKVTKPSATHG
jgi:hypothetical protein